MPQQAGGHGDRPLGARGASGTLSKIKMDGREGTGCRESQIPTCGKALRLLRS